jgi:uncharacterized protein (TIGR02217 family)
MAFLDIQFPQELVSFFNKKVQYVTSVSRMQSGMEFRKNITTSMKVYSLFSAIKRADQIALLEDFFHITQGRMYSFKMHDATDYKIEDMQTKLIDSKKVQIQKVVQFDSVSKAQNITKPKPDTIRVFKNGALLISGYQVNFQTGEIAFLEDISTSIITVSCEFFQHLRFNVEAIVFSMRGNASFEVNNVEMIEVL